MPIKDMSFQILNDWAWLIKTASLNIMLFPNICLCIQYIYLFIFKDFIYLLIRGTHREAETQAEREAGSLWGAQCGTRSQDSGITTSGFAKAQPQSHPGAPITKFFQAYLDIGPGKMKNEYIF